MKRQTVLTDILRKEWGFQGVVVSDVDAVMDVCQNHRYAKSFEEAAADCIRAGCDRNGGPSYNELSGAVRQKLISDAVEGILRITGDVVHPQ